MKANTALGLVMEMRSKFAYEKRKVPTHIKINRDLLQVVKAEAYSPIDATTLFGMMVEETFETVVKLSADSDVMEWGISMPRVFSGTILSDADEGRKG